MAQDLEQRYNKLRVEVQMAQDADEPVTLEEVVRRVMRKEKQAGAAFPVTRAGRYASKPAPAIPGAITGSWQASYAPLIALPLLRLSPWHYGGARLGDRA